MDEKSNLYKILIWLGIISHIKDRRKRQYSLFVFGGMILFEVVECFVTLFWVGGKPEVKIASIYFNCYILSILAWYYVRRRRKQLIALLNHLEKIQPTTNSWMVNAFLCWIFVVLVVLTLIGLWTVPSGSLFLRGLEVKSTYMKTIINLTRRFFCVTAYPTIANIISLLYISLCVRCCKAFKDLAEEIENCPPQFFTAAQQVNVLSREMDIEDILSQVQSVFSVPMFFVFVAHFCSCSALLGLFVLGWIPEMMWSYFLQSALVFFSSLLFAVTSLWFPGGIPKAIDKFKFEFSKNTQRRMFVICSLEESRYERGLFERPSLVLSGCDILHFTKNSILAFAGTLITYTVLVINSR